MSINEPHEYKEDLEDMIYKLIRENSSDQVSLMMLQAPLEYMLLLDRNNLSDRDIKCLTFFYKNLITQMHQTPKKDMLTFLLTCLILILKYFVEVPGVMDLETMGLSLIAAIHSMTYVHTLTVADLSVALAEKLLDKDPDLFIGMPGYSCRQEVHYRETYRLLKESVTAGKMSESISVGICLASSGTCKAGIYLLF